MKEMPSRSLKSIVPVAFEERSRLCGYIHSLSGGVFKRAVALIGVFAIIFMAGHLQAQSTPNATLTDIGVSPSLPLDSVNDQYQLANTNADGTYNAGNAGNINYYDNKSSPVGQTFTTGNNAAGYMLTSLALSTSGGGGNSSGQPAFSDAQQYALRIYSIAGSSASLMAVYYSQTNATINASQDWVQWTGLNTPLAPNTTYAYTFVRLLTTSWEGLAFVTNNSYAGGQVCAIPPAGGSVNYGNSAAANCDAAFDVGLTSVTQLQAGSVAFSPLSPVTVGTLVTNSVTVTGPNPYYYQWQVDGGVDATPTNIPGAIGATLVVDTGTMAPGIYGYSVVISNDLSQVVTSSVSYLAVSPNNLFTGTTNLADTGASYPSSPYDISQVIGGGSSPSDINYYSDNGVKNDLWPGQTFTTGTNAQGYALNSLAIQLSGGNNGGTTNTLPYNLYLYQVRSNSAFTIGHYYCTNFDFNYGDWVTWTGLTNVLQPNTTYAYGFDRGGISGTNSYGLLGLSSGVSNVYAGGQICVLRANGGSLTYSTSPGMQDGVFDVGLSAIGVADNSPFAQAIVISPLAASSGPVPVGTVFSLTESTTNGAAASPLHYIWQTDGGTGGTFTNILNSDVTNLVYDTTGWQPGAYRYQVIVYNAYGYSTSVVASVTLKLSGSMTMSDIGFLLPNPLPADISQTTAPTSPNKPDGLNYYWDSGTPPGSPGQTFTTGSNPGGYTLTSVALALAGGAGGGIPVAGQQYILRVYSVSGSTANLIAELTSQTNIVNTTDWIRLSGFAVQLAPNTTYAYSFARSPQGAGWCNLGNVSGNPYSGGEVCLIGTAGGTINFGSSHSYDGSFNVGLSLPGYPAVGPAVFNYTNPVYAGTLVTATAYVSGSGTLTYQWQTDGGSGGALTNIPGATSPTLGIDTTGMDNQDVAYDLVVTSGGHSTTNEISVLQVAAASGPVIVSDIAPTSVSSFPGGSVTFNAAFEGSLPLSYQWQVDKGAGPVNIVGQTNATLTLNNLKASDAGTYYLAASNSVSTGISSGATLTIKAVPAGLFTINFQWLSTEGGNNVGQYSGPGISGYGTGTYWNVIPGPSAYSGVTTTYANSTSYDDTGVNDLGISASITTMESWDWTSTPVIALLDSAVSVRPSQPTVPFTFRLPNGYYNVVIFSCNGTESSQAIAGANITLAGVSKTALPTQDTNFVEGDNYVVFPSVLVTNATLNGTLTSVSGKSYGSWNGAQLQYLGTNPPPPTNLVLTNTPISGGQFQLQWSQGTLLEATNISGPWTTNTSASSPFSVVPTGPQKFYRLMYP